MAEIKVMGCRFSEMEAFNDATCTSSTNKAWHKLTPVNPNHKIYSCSNTACGNYEPVAPTGQTQQ